MFTQRRSRACPHSRILWLLIGSDWRVKNITVAREHSPRLLCNDRADVYLHMKSHVSLRVQAKTRVRPMHFEMPFTISDKEKNKIYTWIIGIDYLYSLSSFTKLERPWVSGMADF